MGDESVLNAVTCDDITREIRRTMRRSASDAVRLGYMLRQVADRKLYLETHADFNSYLDRELHMDHTLANRYMNINRKFSVGGNSMEIQEKYGKYSQSLLTEMLSMPPELARQVTPDMSSRQARAVKKKAGMTREKAGTPPREKKSEEVIIDGEFREIVEPVPEKTVGEDRKPVAAPQPEPEQQLSPYGLPESEYPEDSMVATGGCGNRYNCYTCAMDCGIRQEDRYCTEAPMGNPFPCRTMKAIKDLKSAMPENCQFVNHGLAYHAAGSGEAVPCCRQCGEECSYRCERSGQPGIPDETDNGPGPVPDAWEILKEQSQLLDDYLAVGGLPEALVEKQRIIVGALAAAVCDLEKQKKQEQPELPVLKNNEQRREWIDSYKSWPLWIETVETGERYYRYDLPDGTSIVVKVYHSMLYDYNAHGEYSGKFREGYGREEYYLLREGKFFHDCETNRSALTDHLKEVQKKGKK